MKKILSFLLTFVLFVTGMNIFGANVSEASSGFEGFACYAKNCKLTQKNRYAKVRIKGNKLSISGWVYKESNKGTYHMEWKKINKQYTLSSKTRYTIPKQDVSDIETITKAKFKSRLKKYGSAYDCVSLYARNKRVESIKIESIAATIKKGNKLPDNTELKVYAKGSCGHGAGEICPLEYGKVSIKDKVLTIKGMISYYDGTSYQNVRVKSGTRKFKIQCAVTSKLKRQIKQLSSKNDQFVFSLENGEVVSMDCWSSDSV